MDITKEQLEKELATYKNILNESKITYLKSLIDLEYSVLREYIPDEERHIMLKLDIYDKVVNYNLLKQTLNFLKPFLNDLIIKYDDEILDVYLKTQMFYKPLIHFDFKKPNKAHPQKHIILNQMVYDQQVDRESLDLLMDILQIYYTSYQKKFLIPAWNIEQHIKVFEEQFNYLDNRLMPSQEQTNIILISSLIDDTLLNLYGINSDELILDTKYNYFDDALEKYNNQRTKSFTKKMPGIKITKKINYI